jgi:hypothetical protein
VPSKERRRHSDKESSEQGARKPTPENLDTLTQQPVHPVTLIQRARLDPNSLPLRGVQQLQRLIGNQAVGKLMKRTELHPVVQPKLQDISVNPGLPPGIIQAWPAPEVNDEPARTSFKIYKCHDAVVYWVLRSLGKNEKEASVALNLLQQKRGPSAGWIVEALNYSSGTRISSAREANVGDILFTGATSYVAHTMVVIDANNIKGFNNFGTFGTAGGGDQYSTENWAAGGFWHDIDGEAQIGTGPEASFPIYKVTIGTAQAALRDFIKTVAAEEDYQSHMDVDVGGKKKKKEGCFITTAVMAAKGLPDDCEELTVLRDFRDGYLMQKPNGRQLVEIYYQSSPHIVDAIAAQENAASIYDHLYGVIRACVEAIKKGDNEFAFTTYCEMVIKLKEQYIPG